MFSIPSIILVRGLSHFENEHVNFWNSSLLESDIINKTLVRGNGSSRSSYVIGSYTYQVVLKQHTMIDILSEPITSKHNTMVGADSTHKILTATD
jgi:hypothetical protein